MNRLNERAPASILLLTAPDERRILDGHLAEVLLTEGYPCFDRLTADSTVAAAALGAYLRVQSDHPWLRGFRAADVQCPGESDVYPNVSAEPLAFVAGQLGLPSVSADEWLAFSDARRSAAVGELVWRPETGDLSFSVQSRLPVSGLTLLLPPCGDCVPAAADVQGEPLAATPVPFEAPNWRAVELDLDADVPITVSVTYR